MCPDHVIRRFPADAPTDRCDQHRGRRQERQIAIELPGDDRRIGSEVVQHGQRRLEQPVDGEEPIWQSDPAHHYSVYTSTIADGARTQSLGALTFPLVLRHVNDIITVSDAELVAAMRILWERMKLVVEPTGALAAAAVMTGAIAVRDRRLGIILSGGNVDLKAAAALFA